MWNINRKRGTSNIIKPLPMHIATCHLYCQPGRHGRRRARHLAATSHKTRLVTGTCMSVDQSFGSKCAGVRVYMCINLCLCTHLYMHTYIYMCVHADECAYVHAYLREYMYTWPSNCTHTQKEIHIYMYKHWTLTQNHTYFCYYIC